MVLASSQMLPQLSILLKRQPVRHLLITLVSLIIIIILLARVGRTSSYVGSLTPYFRGGRGVYSQVQTSLSNVCNATLGFENIFAVSLPERTDHRDGLVLASAVSGIKVEFIDGVHGESISAKALPPKYDNELHPSNIGAWRAHLNAIKAVIERNLSSALIFEDDVDWDVRLKPILQDFALSANALQQGSPADELKFNSLPLIASPQWSPYGDTWDLLWLGHCGMHLPPGGGLVIHENDATVPQPRFLRSFEASEYTPLGIFQDHTRVVMRHQSAATCSLAYAVTQSSARQILYHLGLERLDGPFDLMLRGWCEGQGSNGVPRLCLGALPQLFDHHRRVGPGDIDSDISKPNAEYREKAFTNNIRWSVRMNLHKLLYGDTNYDDQYPDS